MADHEVQLAVLHNDGVYTYYSIEPELGWHVDVVNRQIVVKKYPRGCRDIVPLDGVRNYSVEIKEG